MLQVIHHTSDGFTWSAENVVATFHEQDHEKAEWLVAVLDEFLDRKHRMFDSIELRTVIPVGPTDDLGDLADQFYNRL